ncbi:MAG: gas vesicle protein [Planctomycetota bacterium]
MQPSVIAKSTNSTSLADLLERVLDKGIVIAGDIRINLVEVELLTIQIRLVVCSVDKAKEMGMDWWVNNPAFRARLPAAPGPDAVADLERRLAQLEAVSQAAPASASFGA